MKTGYARCSTNESKQDIDRQVRELKQAGAERVFLEYEHGDAVIKEQLDRCFLGFYRLTKRENALLQPQPKDLNTDLHAVFSQNLYRFLRRNRCSI